MSISPLSFIVTILSYCKISYERGRVQFLIVEI